jgi:hypothetical protein
VNPQITLPTRLDGGPGKDRLQGGSGPNVLLGGEGKNTLIGNPARDTRDGGPGLNRLVIQQTLGVIQVGPSVSGAAHKRLSADYTLTLLEVAGPAVVGPADLRNGRIAGLLKSDYPGGQTVTLANATPSTAAALARMLGYPPPVGFPAGVRRVDLVAFREVNVGGQTTFSTLVLPPVAQGRRGKDCRHKTPPDSTIANHLPLSGKPAFVTLSVTREGKKRLRPVPVSGPNPECPRWSSWRAARPSAARLRHRPL